MLLFPTDFPWQTSVDGSRIGKKTEAPGVPCNRGPVDGRRTPGKDLPGQRRGPALFFRYSRSLADGRLQERDTCRSDGPLKFLQASMFAGNLWPERSFLIHFGSMDANRVKIHCRGTGSVSSIRKNRPDPDEPKKYGIVYANNVPEGDKSIVCGVKDLS